MTASRTLVALVSAVTLSGLGTGAAPPASARATGGLCGDTPHCRIVSRADVDGDGRPDRVAWVNKSRHTAVIRVATADGEQLRRRLDVHLWPRGHAWAGAAHVDGRRGVELLAGVTLGAHTPAYTMLTHRGGRLVVERSPASSDGRWYVDSAYSIALGWWRSIRGGRATMTSKYAGRTIHGNFRGKDVTYTWRHDRWKKTHAAMRHYARDRQAYRIAGWHVRGLDRFPAL